MPGEDDTAEWLAPTTGQTRLPAVEILTGRGFITGKSGSGKSNTASVIAEELLDRGYGLLVVDTEGEYYGLAEEFEMLHAGDDEERCDIVVGPDDARHLAETAIDDNVPVILDVSEFLDGDVARELIANTVRALYHREKEARKPFLLMVEELQEYLPQSGGSGELPDLLERVAKRGRKRGLGMLGMSQRPSSVDKDFITQCDWMVWHRLTWKNDVDIVRNILGPDVASEIEGLDTGEGYLMTDWDDGEKRVQFKRKRTHDAGATPGLDAYDSGDEAATPYGEQARADGEATDTYETPTPDDVAQPGSGSRDIDGGDAAGAVQTPAAGDALPVDAVERSTLEVADHATLVETVLAIDEEKRRIARERDRLRRNTAGGRDALADPTATDPTAPQPPQKPEDRSGVSGNIIEFTALVVYLLQSLSYRLRLLLYRLRSGRTRGRR
ncbi:DUF87 domain-containing protein [Halomicroarcula sp. F28]|uniref:ATP-binding protein n=1 Tax=Haloarcula salinisoli TaxID=2487746 RepID=UPI001C72BBD1|nr:DUF87 domain-containing protein [Halomicroarcula salinisoli]MBX0285981.1 DUF87 domain-containing protein [Halomicroarcula salinisoli]